MIKKFKDFDVHEYLNRKDGLRESLDDNVNDDDVITGNAVYDDPYLFKIARIMIKRIDRSGIGKYGMYHDIVYMNDMPGVWFYGVGEDKYDVVCFRDRNRKCVSIFKNFNPDGDNKDIVTYSTEKLGFGDILDRVIDSFKNGSLLNESMAIFETKWITWGFSKKNAEGLRDMNSKYKIFLYNAIKDVAEHDKPTKKIPSPAPYLKKLSELYTSDKETVTNIIKCMNDNKEVKPANIDYLASFMRDIAYGRTDNLINPSDEPKIRDYIYAEYNTFLETGEIADKTYIESLIKGDSDDSKSLISTEEPEVSGGDEETAVSSTSGTTSAITTSSGTAYSSTSVAPSSKAAKAAAIAAAREKRLKEELDEYTETLNELRETTEAMCDYVKNNGIMTSELGGPLSKNIILITGLGGIGKSHTVNQVLKEKGMVKNRDYKSFGNGSTTAEDIYKAFYDFNGKLIIFDDSPKLFTGEYRVAMWKTALQTDPEERVINYPASEKSLPSNVYKADDPYMTRQQRYFKEMGRKTDKDMGEFFRQEMSRALIRNISSKPKGGIDISDLDIKGITRVSVAKKDYDDPNEVVNIMWGLKQKWQEIAKDASPAMPNSFLFTGVVIIITNSTREDFVKEMGIGHWQAMESRFASYDISPSGEIVWMSIKNKILDEYENEIISDDFRLIPKDITNEFISEVEKLLKEPEYQNMNWRVIKSMGAIIRSSITRPRWKKKLADNMFVHIAG